MKLVEREHIELWASKLASKGDLPLLLSKLVRATTPVSTQVDIDTGSAINIGGWDGKVICAQETDFVPEGISLWEFGTKRQSATKVKEDFAKRDSDTLGYYQADCTLMIVTPRVLKNKNQLQQQLKAESNWKDVRIYDSRNLEQWLERSLAVSKWFAGHLRVLPFDGYQTADEFWNNWSVYKTVKLAPKILTAGRQTICTQLLHFLQRPPDITAIQASTKNEAIAFMIAAAKQFEKDETERFFSRALVIDTVSNYDGIKTNRVYPSILIPTFEDTQSLLSAVAQGHHVIVPLGAGDTFSEQTLYELPSVDRDGQIEALVEMGYSEEASHKLSKEAARDITILKKLLDFPAPKTKWLETEDPREIIPALLAGRWNEKSKGDREVLKRLSGMSYDEYTIVLNKWRDLPESPILQIGENWRLTSPLDLWTSLPRYITKHDLDELADCFYFALQNGNPIIEPGLGQHPIIYRHKETTFSNWVREGLIQSLILAGVYGKRLKISALRSSQQWVDTIISTLLQKADGKLWQSLKYECPLLAEASPIAFIQAVEMSLDTEAPSILEMFQEKDGIIHTQSSYTGLLWALEGLAWLPDFFYDSCKILMRLAALDPGGKLTHRPLNSLHGIFNLVYPQTSIGLIEKLQVLEGITKQEPQQGWKLLMGMLPQYFGIVHPTHKLRWRSFNIEVQEYIKEQELFESYSQVLQLLLNMFDNSEKKFVQLLKISERMQPDNRALILEWADGIYSAVVTVDYTAWHTLRTILHNHRTPPFNYLSLAESELQPYELLYHKLQPADTLNQLVWLFNESWPEFPDGSVYDSETKLSSSVQEGKVIDSARLDAIKKLLAMYGIDSVIALRANVTLPGKLGEAVAAHLTDRAAILRLCATLDDDEPTSLFGRRFFYQKALVEGFAWVKTLCDKLVNLKFSDKAVANALIALEQGFELWDYITTLGSNIEEEYWINVHPFFYNLLIEEKRAGLSKLVEYKRFYSAIEVVTFQTEDFPTDMLMNTLKSAIAEPSIEPFKIRHSNINHLFEQLDKREDREEAAIAALEWLYLPAFVSYSPRRPKLLHKNLSVDTVYFIEVLQWAYGTRTQQNNKEVQEGTSEELGRDIRTRAFQLLESWREIPGVAEDHSIDRVFLKNWIENVRKSAMDLGLLSVADRYIGRVLAQYPENVPHWPAEPIFKVLEDTGSDKLLQHYSSALFNKRGSSSRGMFAGGEIERGHASFFDKLADEYRFRFPKVSKVFSRLAKGYIVDAEYQDDNSKINKLEY